MNLYKTIALTAILIVGFASCDDRLDIKPFDAIETEVALQKPTDFTNAINGAYSGLKRGGYYGGQHILMPDVLADNVIICSEGRFSKQSLYIYEMSGDVTWSILWTDAYKVINRANQILENIDALEAGDFRNDIEGQARALRALAHFDLARAFSKAPAQAGGGDLGIPYITSSDASQRPSRPSVSDTYNQIVEDLEAASALVSADNGVGKFGVNGVNAILSRAYLYMGDWAKANTAATAVINSGALVSSPTDFAAIWTDETDSGVIFKVEITDQDNISPGVEYSQTGAEVRSEYVADYEFYNQYTTTDVRKDAYFSTSAFGSKTFNHIDKYSSRPGSDLNVTDIKVVRMAEVYLNRAEALANMNMDAGALADLDVVRENRYTDFAAGNESGSALKDAVALQRRLELAFEGHRIYDIKRKGEPVNRSIFGDEADGSGLTVPASALSLSAGDSKFEFPIPQSEINANSSMQQNPGY